MRLRASSTSLQRDDRRSGTALLQAGKGKVTDTPMTLEVLVDALAQGAGPLAMDDEDLRQACHLRVVDEFTDDDLGLVHHESANVDLAADLRRFP